MLNKNQGKRKGLIVSISDYTCLQRLDFCKKDGQENEEEGGKIGSISQKKTEGFNN